MKTLKHFNQLAALIFAVALFFLIFSNTFHSYFSPGPSSFILQIAVASIIASLFQIYFRLKNR